MVFALTAITIFAIALVCGLVFIVRSMLEQTKHVYREAVRVHEQAAILAASQHDAGVKYATAMIDRAEVIAKHVDDRTAARVKQINAVLRPNAGPRGIDPIEEAPAPPVSMGGIMDEFHEIMRETNRQRPEKEPEYSVRDYGIGAAEEL